MLTTAWKDLSLLCSQRGLALKTKCLSLRRLLQMGPRTLLVDH